MTQEQQEFVDEFIRLAYQSQDRATNFAEGFFIANVCVPKGIDRHTQADILHTIIENGNGQRKFADACDNKWEDWKFYPVFEYHLKPDPMYEYMVVDNNGIIDWMTIDEFEGCDEFKFIAEGTKRVRQ